MVQVTESARDPKPWLALLACALLVACSSGADLAASERQVARFRELYARGDYRRVHSEASLDFQRSTKVADLERFLQVVSSRLGTVRSAQRQNVKVMWHTGSNTVTLTYATQFAKGNGVETFSYRVTSGSASLAGYHVSSLALIAPASAEEVATAQPAPASPIASEFQALVAERTDAVRGACWEPAIRRRTGPLPEARVVVALVVEPTGAVDVQATSDFAVDYPGLADCVTRTVDAWQFGPRPTASNFSVPFVFKAP